MFESICEGLIHPAVPAEHLLIRAFGYRGGGGCVQGAPQWCCTQRAGRTPRQQRLPLPSSGFTRAPQTPVVPGDAVVGRGQQPPYPRRAPWMFLKSSLM
ncbi:hypothetical protein GN956_G8457 [Arapaima gigas]